MKAKRIFACFDFNAEKTLSLPIQEPRLITNFDQLEVLEVWDYNLNIGDWENVKTSEG